MVTKNIYDKSGNLLYEEHDDGYKEMNTYNNNGKLIRQEIHYSNGLVEVEHYSNN